MTGSYKKAITPLLTSGFLATALAISGCGDSQTEQDASMHIKRGETYLSQGQFKAAMIEARNALQIAPTEPESNLLMTDILMAAGQYKRAQEQLESVENRNSADYLLTQAELYNNLRKFRSASELLLQHESSLRSADAGRYLEQFGRAKLGLNDVQAARTAFQQLENLDTNKANALTLLAQLSVTESNIPKASELVEQALTANSGFTEALLLKARLHYQKNELAGAEDALTQALTSMDSTDIMTPARANILRSLAQILTLQGRSSEALIYTRLLAEAFPGSEMATDKLRTALASYKEGKSLEEIRDELQALLEEYPGYEQAKQSLAIVDYLQGNLEAANNYFKDNLDPETAPSQLNEVAALTGLRLNQYQQVLEMLEGEITTADNPNLLALYGVAALSSNAPEKGESALLKAIEMEPKPQYRLLLANFYNQQTPAAPQKALEQLQRAYDDDKTLPSIQNALVVEYLKQKQPQKALALVKEVLVAEPDNKSSHILAGKYYLTQRQLSEAKTAFGKATELSPEDPEPLLYLARIQTFQKDYASAEKTYKQVIDISSESPIAYRGLLAIGIANSQPDKAIRQLNHMASAKPENITPLLVLAEYYLRQSNLAETKAIATKVTGKFPDDARVRNLNAQIAYTEALEALRSRDFNAARVASLQGLQYVPESAPLLNLLAQSEIYAGNTSEAEKVIEQISMINPIVATELQGDLTANSTPVDYSSALGYYQDAWKKTPSDRLGQKIINSYTQLKEPGKAEIFLKDWLQALPDSLIANNIKTSQLMAKNDFPGAISQLEKLLSKNPTQPVFLNNLAWSYLQTGEIERALEHSSKAYELAPANPSIADTYGWILFKANKTPETALEVLKKAAELAPENRDIQEHYETVRNAL